MKKVEAQPFMRSLIIVAVLAATFSSFTLWLIESWIKYPLFLFEILTIIVLYLIVSGYDVKLTIKHIRIENMHIGLIIDAFLIISALSLLTINALHIQGGLIQLVLALLCTSLLSGYALLNIFGLTRYSRLETTVLSYILSYAFTGFITLAFLPINRDLRALIVLSSFIVLGLTSALKHRRHQASHVSKSLSKSVDSLALIVAITFYAISFYFMYPGFALLPGTDISRHYASSVVLWRTPELSIDISYLLAHLHESAFISISNAPVTFVQTALVTLNLMTPLAFYAMAKSYLENVDARLPAISTMFYSTFSGFAWVYLAKLKLEGVSGSELSLLSMVNDKVYNGAMYLAQPCMWYVPLSVSFTILIIQFMLLRKLDIGKKHFIALFSLLTVASYLTHVTEAVIFSLFLSFYAFFSRSKNVRVDDGVLATIIGFVLVDIFYAILPYVSKKSLGFFITTLLLPTTILIIVYAYRRLTAQGKLAAFLSKLTVKLLIKPLLYITTFIYFLGLVVWIGSVPSFHTWAIIDVGSIPWFIYPVFLGIIGILTVVSIYCFLEDFEARKLLMPFVALVVFSLLFGRILTFVNVNFFYTGYWEKRFTSYFFLASAVIAPFVMVKAAENIKTYRNKVKSTLVIAALISIVVTYGLQSFFMVAEYWNITSATYRPSEEELQAISFLSNVLQQDKYAYTITLTSRSYHTLAFAAPPYQLTGKYVFFTAKNPEMSLLCCKAHNLSHAYLYMHSRDYEMLNKHGQSWMARHLIPILPVIYRNNEVTIYNVSSVSFPQKNSTTALIVPFDDFIDPGERWLYAYAILSLGECNYTVTYDLDPGIFLYETLVLSVDPPSKNILEEYFQDDFSNETGWRPFSGTWQYTANGLEAGKPGEYQDAIFLSPFSPQNFTVSLSFRPIDGDLTVANYVSLIYDWKDERNFKYAGLMFDGSGEVYAFFSSNKNGTNYPTWPGLRTGLKWKFGDSFNLTVSVRGDTATLYVNGSRYLSTKSTITKGGLGIRMTRFYQVLFTGFKADLCSALQLGNNEEYLSHVEGGGHLIVLNTNGYGYFAEKMLIRENRSIESYGINGLEDVVFPANLTVPKISPKAENVEIITCYKSQQNSSLYAARQKLGSGEVIYVNVYPIIEAIEQSNNKASFYKTLGELLKLTSISLEPFTYNSPELSATFRQVALSGSVFVSSSCTLFPLYMDYEKVAITHDNNSVTTILDVKQIQMSDYVNVHIEASDLTLSNGKGFYATLKFRGKVTIMPEDNSTSMTVSTVDGNTNQFSNIKIITLENDDLITLYVRQPAIQVQGTALFREVYSSSAIYQKTRTQGEDLRVNGSIKLILYLSDAYSWTSLLEASGSFERIPPVLAYNELSSLPQAAFWSLLLAPAFLIMVFIVERRKPKNELVRIKMNN
jgi:hypothetical protein